MRRGQWEKVGDVVGGPGEGSGDTLGVGGKWHRGRQWDYVVDVDFADGVPPKKLAFDRADNPYLVAERCARLPAPPAAAAHGSFLCTGAAADPYFGRVHGQRVARCSCHGRSPFSILR